jgi:hypothetical protein
LGKNTVIILQTTRTSDQLSAPPYSALLSASVIFVDGRSPVHENHNQTTSASLWRVKVPKRIVSPKFELPNNLSYTPFVGVYFNLGKKQDD